MKRIKNVIVGAGPAGLILADRLNEPKDTLILSQNIGGLLRSHFKEGFIFDMGGHVYTASDHNVTELLTKIGATFHYERKAFWNSKVHGRIPFPVQNYMATSPLDDEKRLKENSLAEYAINQFGHKFYEDFFRPFNQRIWTLDPRFLHFDWVGERVASSNEKQDKRWGINASFYYTPGYRISNALTHKISNIRIRSHIKVLGFDYNPHTLVFETPSGHFEALGYERLFITHEGIGATNTVCLVCVGLNHELDDDFHWMYPDFDSPVHRITLISRYHPYMAPPGKDSLLLEVPWGPHTERPAILDERQSKEFIASYLLKVSGFEIGTRSIETVDIFAVKGYPIPTIGIRHLVAGTKERGLASDVFYLGRWGSHGYFNLQHIFMDVEATMKQLETPQTPMREYLWSTFYFRRNPWDMS